MTTQTNSLTTINPRPSALAAMAARFNMDPVALMNTLKNTVFKGASNEQLAALVVVANEHGLNPFTREIYAFPDKSGGIQAVIGLDGWARIIASNPAFDGVEFAFTGNNLEDLACTCVMHVKGRAHPVAVTEYYAECSRNTEPWRTYPRRMLRHKALIQAGRIAFGLGSLRDEDEVQVHPASATVFADAPAPVAAPMIDAARDAEHVAEAAAGLAPAVSPAPPAPAAPAKSHVQQLAELVESNGFTYDQFQRWAVETGNVEDCDSRGNFDEIPEAVAKRLLRSPNGLLKGLAATKGGQS